MGCDVCSLSCSPAAPRCAGRCSHLVPGCAHTSVAALCVAPCGGSLRPAVASRPFERASGSAGCLPPLGSAIRWAPHVTLGGHEDQAQTRTPRSTDLGKGSATWWYPHTVRVDRRIRGGAFCKSFDLHSAPCSKFESIRFKIQSVAVTARSTSDDNHCGRANTLVLQYR